MKLELLCLFFFFSANIFSMAPVSKVSEIKSISSGSSLEEVFKQGNPLIIDLSNNTLEKQHPTKKHPFTSILLINGDKKIKNFSHQTIIDDQYVVLQKFGKTAFDPKYESLFVLLRQMLERFTYRQGELAIQYYIADVIRNHLLSKGYSWWKLRNIKNFNPEFIIFELVKNAIVHGNTFDLSKPIIIAWDVDALGQFTIKVGDYSPSVLVENDEGIKKIINGNNDPEFAKKVDVAKNAFFTGENHGIDYIQKINNKRWSMNIEPIISNSGNIIGKFTVVQTFLRNERVRKRSYLKIFKEMFTDFVRVSA